MMIGGGKKRSKKCAGKGFHGRTKKKSSTKLRSLHSVHLFYSEANARRISNSFKIFSLFLLDKKISCQLRILPIYYFIFLSSFFLLSNAFLSAEFPYLQLALQNLLQKGKKIYGREFSVKLSYFPFI